MAHAGWGETPKKTSEPAGKTAQRRSRRVVQTIRIKVFALSSDGKPVEREAETLVVSRNGARIHTDLPLQLGAAIRVMVLRTGTVADAIVTWVSPESNYEFGIELTQAIDIWGVHLSRSASLPPHLPVTKSPRKEG